MRKHSARIFAALLRLLLPGKGRHRAADSADDRHIAQWPDGPATRPACVNAYVPRLGTLAGPKDGHGRALVRPYVAAHEQGQEQRRNSGPRVESVCAPHRMAGVR